MQAESSHRHLPLGRAPNILWKICLAVRYTINPMLEEIMRLQPNLEALSAVNMTVHAKYAPAGL